MSVDKNSLGYLGLDYQMRLLAQVFLDRKFANNILLLLKPNYFDNEFLKIISSELINAFETDEVILDYGSLEYRLLGKFTNEAQRVLLKDHIKKIKEVNPNDAIKIQETAIKFCKQQETKKVIVNIQKIIDTGDLDSYDQIEDQLKKALEIGEITDDGEDNFDDIAKVLSDDYRKPIPTGIAKLDEIMNGGLSKGELGIVLAALGVGKTTCATKFANTAFNMGYNVLQIFFEDTTKIIKRKHLACWSGHQLNDLENHVEELVELKNKKFESGGRLLLKKFSSIDTNMVKIKNYVKKQIAMGYKPDMILIDYIDCVQPSRSFTDNNLAEAMIMREVESLGTELDIAMWVFTQGNRSAIKSDVVDTDQMGGSIKKAQIGHFILSIARPLKQKEEGKATFGILKSRFGQDGVIFSNVTFDNSRIFIDIGEESGVKTFLENKNEKDINSSERMKKLMEEMNKIKNR